VTGAWCAPCFGTIRVKDQLEISFHIKGGAGADIQTRVGGSKDPPYTY
jgi:hypothetical protein